MTTWMKVVAGAVALWAVTAGPAMAQDAGRTLQESLRVAQEAYRVGAYGGMSKEQLFYMQATAAADENRWDRALDLFSQVVALKGDRADAALYWKAYVQNKLGQRPEALATIQQLLREFAKSRWLSDARALEVEVRNLSGQPVRPEAESDDELKLLALNGLMNTDPDQAIGILQKLLQGPQSPRMKKRALFVLSQNRSPKAKDLLVGMAKGASNPDLQREAIGYLGMTRSPEQAQLLAEIYAVQTQSAEVRREVANALYLQGSAKLLVDLARKESNRELKKYLVERLSQMKAKEAVDYMLELIGK